MKRRRMKKRGARRTLAGASVRDRHGYLPIEPTRAPQSRVERVGAISCAKDEHRASAAVFERKLIHARQKLRHDATLHFALRSLSLGCNHINLRQVARQSEYMVIMMGLWVCTASVIKSALFCQARKV
jgi:hypothetical protein